LQGNNVLLAGKKFTDFRPGMHLDSVFTVYMPVKKGVQGFVMAGQAERLQMSQCFKISNKNNIQIYNPKINLTCITCHNPHVSVKETNIQKFNNACTQCHNANGNSNKKKCSEKVEKIAFMQNNCVKCHMPASATSDIPHVTVHDHYIRKPEKISLVKNSNEITDIKAVNTENTDRKNYIEGLISYFEKFEAAPLIMQKAGVKLKEITNNSTLYVHYYFANQQWSKIILYASEIEAEKADAWTCYRMAKALDKTGKPAAEWYKNAYEKQNLNAGFAAEYANYLIRNNRLKEARIVLEKVYKQEEKNELILLNLGSVEMLEGNLSKAKNYWLQCLLLNPDNVLTRMNIAELYYKVGDLKQAKIEITEALRIDKNNAEAAAFLKNLY
jgi:Tfp pilus assembly protein PilF